MNIAIIPARSGSKGLIDKNIKCISDMPLLAHAIKCAEHSSIFDEIFVSTDSSHYADIAVQYGGYVPFLRTPALANDTASIWDTVKMIIDYYEKDGKHFDMITVLQPTSPLRTSTDIINAYELFQENKADSVISVCSADHAPYLYNILPKNHSLDGFINKDMINMQRQQLSEYYRINGAIYMLKDKNANLYGKNSFAYIMPKERSVDIDDEWDFLIAQMIFEKTFNKE